ncbi:19082_t:CDS:2, partial [Racocetra persica]
QITMAMMTDQCSINPDGLAVNIKVIESTFNEYWRMVKNIIFIWMLILLKMKTLSEPLSGIYKGEAAIGIAQFTTSATTKFEAFPQDGKTKYICINLTDKIQKENTVPGIITDLDVIIRHKCITTFFDGLTNDLDSTYGFKTKGGLLENYEKAIISLLLAAAANAVIYLMSQTGSSNVFSEGLFVFSRNAFSTTFSFSDVDSKPEFSLPR